MKWFSSCNYFLHNWRLESLMKSWGKHGTWLLYELQCIAGFIPLVSSIHCGGGIEIVEGILASRPKDATIVGLLLALQWWNSLVCMPMCPPQNLSSHKCGQPLQQIEMRELNPEASHTIARYHAFAPSSLHIDGLESIDEI